MTKNILSLLFLLFLLPASWALGSEARVDAAGGISLVITDETQSINPFTLGNPAGLSLLPAQSRLDYAGQWFKQSTAFDLSKTVHFYGTLNELGNDSINYHGLIFFPAKDWALQADGDFNHLEGQNDAFFPEQSQDRTRETFRTAFHFGSLVLGGSLQAAQYNLTPKLGTSMGPGQLTSASATASYLAVNGGLLLSFPGNPEPRQERFLIGGVYANEINPPQEKDSLTLTPLSGNDIHLTASLSTTALQSWGPEIYFIVPGVFEGAVLGRFTNLDVSSQLVSDDASVPDIPTYPFETSDSQTGLLVLKASHPLLKSLALKSGLLFSYTSSRRDLFNSDGSANTADHLHNWQVQGGFGLESMDDFTVGLQAQIQNDSGTRQSGANPAQTVGFSLYKLSLGGERWLSKHWAFRVGIIYENDFDGGQTDYQTFYYLISDGQRLINNTITAGLGFSDTGFRSDLMLSYSQPYLYDSPDPEFYATQLGAELTATALFN